MQDASQPPFRRRTADRRAPSVLIRWLAILLLLVTGALVWTLIGSRGDGADVEPAQPRAIAPRGDLAADEQATIELFESVSPSVVHITNLKTRRSRFSLNVMDIPQGTGTGFLWDDKGHVVTNYHVIRGGDHAEVTLSDNSAWRGEIIGVAPDKDLAVVRIKAPRSKLKPIPLGDSIDLRVGQKVFAIGNPFGLDQTLTTGVISGLGREIRSVTDRSIFDVIQTDASINPGNSGGPLLDSHGRMVGVNTAIYSPSGANAGIGFAVPASTVNRVVPQLIEHGKVVRPGIGINIGNDQMAAQLNLEGVLIMQVIDGTAAAQAGLRGVTSSSSGGWILGDVIVALNEEPVRNSSDMFRLLDQHAVGDTIVLTIDRKGKRVDVEITLQALPN